MKLLTQLMFVVGVMSARTFAVEIVIDDDNSIPVGEDIETVAGDTLRLVPGGAVGDINRHSALEGGDVIVGAESIFEMTGGIVESNVIIGANALANIRGGVIGEHLIVGEGSGSGGPAIVNVFGGSIGAFDEELSYVSYDNGSRRIHKRVVVWDEGVVNIRGGEITHGVSTVLGGTIHWFGGSIGDGMANLAGTIHVYGYDLLFNELDSGPSFVEGRLTGTLSDGTVIDVLAANIEWRNEVGEIFLHAVPEPDTQLMPLIVVGLVLGWRRLRIR